jgi:CRP-like cAMP-binding protein
MTLSRDDLQLIQSTPLFGGLGEAALRALSNNATPVVHPRKALLFQEGDRATHFYVVLGGLVKLFRLSYDGTEAVIHVFGRGEIFAECAMFLDAVYPVSAEVVAPARLLRIEATSIRRAIEEQPDIAFAMLASASRHLKLLVDQIEQMKVHSATERVAEFLLGLTDERKGRIELSLPYEKILIANTLGMTPESFSRALAKLRDIDVQADNDRVVIGDLAGLARFVRCRQPDAKCSPCAAPRCRNS